MKKRKKYVAIMCAALLAFSSLLQGCGKTETVSENSTKEVLSESSEQQSTEPDKITFAFFCNLFIPEDMDMIEEALNEQTRKKINVEVELVPLSLGTYNQQINLMVSGNEKLDLYIMFGGDFSSAISQNKLLPIAQDTLQEYAPGVVDALGDYLKASTVGDKIYGLPVNKDMAQARGISLNKEILEKYDLVEMGENISNTDDLAELFAIVSEKEPGMVMTSSQDNGKSILESGFASFDKMGDYYGVLMNCGENDYQLVNLYETEWYKDTLNYIRDWYNKGWILSDGSINPDTGMGLYKSGRLFSYMGDKKPGGYVDVQNSTGIPTLDARMSQAVATTDSINGVVMAIPITCEDEIPVLKFLNLLYSDPDVLNIIDWGIEGVHYERVKGTNTLITYPEGVTSENDGYGLNQGWSFGNQLISYAWETVENDNYYDEMKAFNENAIQSQAIGFIFDSSSVKSEIAALDSVLAEYRLGLENGELDPEEYLPKFIQALREAGIEKVIAEKQRQLDSWVAEK